MKRAEWRCHQLVCCNTFGFMYNFGPYLLSYTIISYCGIAASDFITDRAQCLVSLHSDDDRHLSSNVSYQTFHREDHTVEFCSTAEKNNKCSCLKYTVMYLSCWDLCELFPDTIFVFL